MGHDFSSSDLNDIKTHLVYLGEGIKGFVYVSKRGVPHIFISESLSEESVAETLAHEIYHLKYDKVSHGIGLDQEQEDYERRANNFASRNRKMLMAYMSKSTTI